MKTRLVHSIALTSLFGASVAFLPQMTNAANGILDLSLGNTVSLTIQEPFWLFNGDFSQEANPSYLILGVQSSGISGVPPGIYPAWCIDSHAGSTFGPTVYAAKLYSSTDPGIVAAVQNNAPGYDPSVYVSAHVWHQINYLLNYKKQVNANWWDVQLALWSLIGGPPPTDDEIANYMFLPPPNWNNVSNLVAASDTPAAQQWQPQVGDSVAVVAVIPNWQQYIPNFSEPPQLMILEVPCQAASTTTTPVVDAPCNKPASITPASSSITAGNSQTFSVPAISGAPVNWSGPNGFSATTPSITVSAAGTYSVICTDSAGCTLSGSATLTVAAAPQTVTPSLAITCVVGSGQVGVPYSSAISASGGTPSYKFALSSGNLPTGLSLNTSSGAITGIPTKAGIYSYVAQVTDSATKTASGSSGISICGATVCGSVLFDCNADGNLTGDAGIAGVSVTLKIKSGTILGRTTTDATGAYCFSSLTGGTYIVTVSPPANYVVTTGGILSSWKDWFGNTCWIDCKYNYHWKGSDNIHHWSCSDGSQYYRDKDGKDYCKNWNGKFKLINRGGDCDDIDDSAGKSCWKDSGGLTHWWDNSNRDSWKDNSGCIHRKDSSGNECWKTKDGTRHWLDCDGKHHWKDSHCKRYCDSGPEDDKDVDECGGSTGVSTDREISVGACQDKIGVNFGLTGTAPNLLLTETANKSTAKQGDVITYTFTLKNTGNTCFPGGLVVSDPMLGGQIFQKSSVMPGASFTFTASYTVKSSDCSYWGSRNLVNTATAVGHVAQVPLPNGGTLQDVSDTGSATVSVSKY